MPAARGSKRGGEEKRKGGRDERGMKGEVVGVVTTTCGGGLR